jgi:formate/nitrite transporter FocA (FNT family)
LPKDKLDENGSQPKGISRADKEKARERSAISAKVIHEAIREEGIYELERPTSALLLSGLASGLSMGFSLISQGLISTYLPNASWTPLVSSFGYTIGFMIVVLGQQQLFTENTLTAVIPVLHEPSRKNLLNMFRLWGIVLITNLVGAFIVAWFTADSGIFRPQTKAIFLEIGQKAISPGPTTVFYSAIFAGWLIALMVWLLPPAETGRIWIIIIITYFIALGGMSHVIAGSVDTLYLVVVGNISFVTYLQSFLFPTLIGNIIGGVLIVAALNHGQVVAR